MNNCTVKIGYLPVAMFVVNFEFCITYRLTMSGQRGEDVETELIVYIM